MISSIHALPNHFTPHPNHAVFCPIDQPNANACECLQFRKFQVHVSNPKGESVQQRFFKYLYLLVVSKMSTGMFEQIRASALHVLQDTRNPTPTGYPAENCLAILVSFGVGIIRLCLSSAALSFLSNAVPGHEHSIMETPLLPTQDAAASQGFEGTSWSDLLAGGESSVKRRRIHQDTSVWPGASSPPIAASGVYVSGYEPPTATAEMDTEGLLSNPRDRKRRDKHRALEQQRRDDLKRNTERLATLLDYPLTKNTNAVVCAAITALEQADERERQPSATIAAQEVQIQQQQLQLRMLQQQLGAPTEHISSARPTESAHRTQQNVNFREDENMVHHSLSLWQSGPSSNGGNLWDAGQGDAFAQPLAATPTLLSPALMLSSTSPDDSAFQPLQMLEPEASEYHVDFAASADSSTQHVQLTDIARALTQRASSLNINYELIFQNHSAPRALCNSQHIIVDCSSAFCEDVGYTREEVIGMPASQLSPSIKQAIFQQLSAGRTHGAPAVSMLSCFRRKRGGVVFRFGQFEQSWSAPSCGHHAKVAMMAARSGNGTSSVHSTPNSSSSTDSESNAGKAPVAAVSVGCPTIPSCPTCGATVSHTLFVGMSTHWADMPNLLALNLRAALALMGLPEHVSDLDEIRSTGAITYEPQSVCSPKHINNQNGPAVTQNPLPSRSERVSKMLPPNFVSAMHCFEAMARTAAATRTSPPWFEI